MPKIYCCKATTIGDVPARTSSGKTIENCIVKGGQEVTIEFRPFDLTRITKGEKTMTGHTRFYKEELHNFRVEEIETSDDSYDFCANSTQHRYALTQEDAEQRLEWLNTSSYFLAKTQVCA